jgi:cyclic pyranopterin phosphate synthase
MSAKLTHIGDSGEARMVDVGCKESTSRRAVARTRVLLSPETFGLLTENALPKGEALNTARIAGIQAGKRTHELIPLCHPLPITYLDVRLTPVEADSSVEVEAEARTDARTGVEMEALVAAQAAALTVYDMCKAVQKDIRITDCRLVFKSGGKSGTYEAE